MRYTRWLAAATAALLLAALGSAPASAGGTTDVSIMLQAQYVTEVVVSVALHVTCEGDPLPGDVFVTVEQEPPETQSPTGGRSRSGSERLSQPTVRATARRSTIGNDRSKSRRARSGSASRCRAHANACANVPTRSASSNVPARPLPHDSR